MSNNNSGEVPRTTKPESTYNFLISRIAPVSSTMPTVLKTPKVIKVNKAISLIT